MARNRHGRSGRIGLDNEERLCFRSLDRSSVLRWIDGRRRIREEDGDKSHHDGDETREDGGHHDDA